VLATNWQIGDRIQNRWEIYKILKGGIGIVYIVYDHELHAPLAAKTFQDEVNAATVERFTHEALTWVNLDRHQNVTEALFVKTSAGRPYLFLEYVSGGDLSKWIGTPLLTEDLPQALRFAIQFCNGMTHALSKGIAAHRDIKPQNCLITQDKTLKVADFGLSKVLDNAWQTGAEMSNRHRLTVGSSRTGAAAGTCTHMAPEQFDDAKHVDVRADVYSFGIMLYQMITGKLPFVGRSFAEFEQLHKTQRVPPLVHHVPELTKIVKRCLAKESASRYGDFGAVRAALVEIYERVAGEQAPQPITGAALDATQWNNKGASLIELGRTNESLECFDRALRLNPHLIQAWYNKGSALAALDRSEEALTCLDRAIAIDPSDEKAWYHKGVALDGLGDREKALACLDRALVINPRYALAWNNKGSALYGLGRPEEALICFDRALVINPHLEESWSNRGTELDRLGRSAEALDCYDRALAINPRSKKTWCNKGVVLKRSKRLEEALDCFDRALEIDPRYAVAWVNKADALDRLGRTRQALDCYDRALAINSRDTTAWYNKGVTLYERDRREMALKCFECVLEIDPRNAKAWFYKGAVLAYVGSLSEALRCFKEAERFGYQSAKAIAQIRRALGQL
jgi:tetratricopeptide (TPR) repeat protein